MTSNRPYLLRAMHEWLTDNGDVPHILVDGGIPALDVVRDFVEQGKITLNISYDATQSLQIDNQDITFQARFAGQPIGLRIPIAAVLGVFGRDSGQGMMFPEEADNSETEDAQTPKEETDAENASHLKVVK